MPFSVVDYREVHYVVLNNDQIPQECRGKFVLIASDDEQFAVFSPQGLSRYHANIVERFLSLRSVSGYYNDKRDRYDTHSPDWQILGGGRWELNGEKGTLCIFGFSQAYGGVDLNELAASLLDAGGVGGCKEIIVR